MIDSLGAWVWSGDLDSSRSRSGSHCFFARRRLATADDLERDFGGGPLVFSLRESTKPSKPKPKQKPIRRKVVGVLSEQPFPTRWRIQLECGHVGLSTTRTMRDAHEQSTCRCEREQSERGENAVS